MLSASFSQHRAHSLISERTNLCLIRILAISALLLGIWARAFRFGEVPLGLNQDEASIGYEAWSLLHYGIDRNGFSWPVHLMSWSDGQNALYAYFAMPFIASGLSIHSIRLPMLLAACASLALVWISASRLFGEKAGWSATTATALSPWHIMLSRWALESNLLPFVFLCGFTCLVIARDSIHRTVWIVFAGALFGLSLYAYGTAYLAVPIFVLGALSLGVKGKDFTPGHALAALAAFTIVALPIGTFVLINLFKWHTISVAGITMPRLPVFRAHSMVTSTSYSADAADLWNLLITQNDGSHYNVIEPYGILYSTVFFILAAAAAILTVVFAAQRRWPVARALLACWLISTLPTGLVQQANINRVNLLLAGMVFAAGVAAAILDKKFRGAVILAQLGVAVASLFFIHSYFAERGPLLVFSPGFVPALQRAQAMASSTQRICVTEEPITPYIYALFSERTDPREFLRTVQYDGTPPTWFVTEFGRYTFGLSRCDFSAATAVIAATGEKVPSGFEEDSTFYSFRVFVRQHL